MSKQKQDNCPFCQEPQRSAYNYQEHVTKCADSQKAVQIKVIVSTGEKMSEISLQGKDMWTVHQKLNKYIEFVDTDWSS